MAALPLIPPWHPSHVRDQIRQHRLDLRLEVVFRVLRGDRLEDLTRRDNLSFGADADAYFGALVRASSPLLAAFPGYNYLNPFVQGVVLSSTVTNSDRAGTGLSAFDFGSIKVPVLLVHHRDDGCRSSPYYGAERLAKKFPLISVSGGDPPQSEPCEAMSQHGYLGREAPTAQAIRNWMLGREFAREIQ